MDRPSRNHVGRTVVALGCPALTARKGTLGPLALCFRIQGQIDANHRP
jgi:hypothetical protein